MHRRQPGRPGRTVLLGVVAALVLGAGVTTALLRLDSAPGAPSSSGPTTTPAATTPAAPLPTTTPAPPPLTPQAAVKNAAAIGQARGARVAVAVHDRQTGAFYTAGEVDASYPSASLVKPFIATRLLVDGQARDQATRDVMWKMIVFSDDASASQLYPVAGGQDLIPWIIRRYHVTGLKPTTRTGAWGLTQITARAMVTFYAAVAKDPLVGPWLLDAMSKTQPKGSDGWPQMYGIPAATDGWRVKQGWLCCVDDKSRMHSTGFVNHDRYTVALLTEAGRSTYGDVGAETLNLMAQALMPDGSFPALP